MALLSAVIALAFPLYAVDGVVLINQSAALAGNLTPGDAPGFPVTISVSGSYRLSGNLTVPDANTTAILITAENVTIDLNGFSILGSTVCSGFPTSCSPTGSGHGITGGVVKNISVFNGESVEWAPAESFLPEPVIASRRFAPSAMGPTAF